MKKFLNDPESIVRDSLVGLAAAHDDLVRVDVDRRTVFRREAPTAGKVAVVSGGGSGHEPLHSGFVGHGMLDAACMGPVFTSPSSDQILAATKAVDGGAGVVYIVKNYTGDVLHFTLAKRLAEQAGIEVEIVLTSDDVATAVSSQTAGRRGTGVTPLVEKIAGASAEAAGSLAEVAAVARSVNQRGRSLGVALTSCVVPEFGTPTFELGPEEIEFGVGIHGESGTRRETLVSAREIVAMMLDEILAELQPSRGAPMLAVVNGFGATPLMELYVVFGELVDALNTRGVALTRKLVGNYVTCLDMAGMSITLLVLDDELTALWDAPVRTVGLRWGPGGAFH